MRGVILLFLFIISFVSNSYSQSFGKILDNTETLSDSLIRDERAFLKSAIKPKSGKKIIQLMGFSAATIGLINNDVEIYKAVKNYQDKHSWVSKLSPIVTLGGDNYAAVSVTGAFIGAGILFNDRYTIKTGELLFRSLIHTTVIVKFSKILFGRARPSMTMRDENWDIDYNMVYDKWNWFPESINAYRKGGKFKFLSNYDAFPSGHTCVAFTMATVIAKRYKTSRIIPVISYSIASLVGLSRITEDTHWLSDCIVG
jgi:membrane-associated phospholipid phosphatase